LSRTKKSTRIIKKPTRICNGKTCRFLLFATREIEQPKNVFSTKNKDGSWKDNNLAIFWKGHNLLIKTTATHHQKELGIAEKGPCRRRESQSSCKSINLRYSHACHSPVSHVISIDSPSAPTANRPPRSILMSYARRLVPNFYYKPPSVRFLFDSRTAFNAYFVSPVILYTTQ